MWDYETSIETDARIERIWSIWADVENWGTWNSDIEKIEINGPFAVGSEIVMTPAGQDPVHLRIADLVEGRRFVDEAEFGGVTVRTTHRLDRLDGDRIRVTYRTEITGPAADELGPQVGPAITADFPQTLAALVARADGRP